MLAVSVMNVKMGEKKLLFLYRPVQIKMEILKYTPNIPIIHTPVFSTVLLTYEYLGSTIYILSDGLTKTGEH